MNTNPAAPACPICGRTNVLNGDAHSHPLPPRRLPTGAVYDKLPAVPSDQADYHTTAQWHVCVACRESWLCREHHAHGHPGCPGKPVVLPSPRKPWPKDWRPREGDDA